MVEQLASPPLIEAYRRAVVSEQVTSDVRRVRLWQVGEMRLQPDGDWVRFTAEQTISATDVEFRWRARSRMAPLLWLDVVDAYEAGAGALQLRLWGWLPLASRRGPELDEGETQRYLAELPWCPLALAQNRQLRFEQLGERRVRVSTTVNAASIDLSFDDAGLVCGVRAEARAHADGNKYPWEGEFFDYTEMSGLRVPTRAQVAWCLPTGRFVYWKGYIDGLQLE